MSPRSQRDRRRGGSPRVGRAAATTRTLLVTVAQLVLLAILAGALTQAVAILIEQPSSLGPHATALSYAACALGVASIALMLAMALNATFLPDRLFAPERLGVFFVVVGATGAAAIVVGLLGSFKLGTVVAVDVLLGAVPFVLLGLVSPGLFRRPARPTGEPDRTGGPPDRGDDQPAARHDRSRQRRGGRGRR